MHEQITKVPPVADSIQSLKIKRVLVDLTNLGVVITPKSSLQLILFPTDVVSPHSLQLSYVISFLNNFVKSSDIKWYIEKDERINQIKHKKGLWCVASHQGGVAFEQLKQN